MTTTIRERRTKAEIEFEDTNTLVHYGFRLRKRGQKVQVDLGRQPSTDGTKMIHKRVTCGDLKEAMRVAEDFRAKEPRQEESAMRLSQEQQVDAVKAYEILEGRGVRLEQIARTWIEGHPEIAEGPTVRALVADFVKWMETTEVTMNGEVGGYRQPTIDNARTKLAIFTEFHGDEDASRLTKNVLNDFLKKEISGSITYRNNIRRSLSLLFNWATDEGGALEAVRNPMKECRPLRDKRRARPPILSALDTERYLRAVRNEHKGSFAVLFFAGLRPYEMLNLDPADIGDQEIYVRADTSKVGIDRYVEVTDNLRAWLQSHPFKAPTSAELANTRKMAKTVTGISWPQDLARHSYGTYLGALKGSVYAANQMGNSETVFRSRYESAIRNRREEAEQYFNIRPD